MNSATVNKPSTLNIVQVILAHILNLFQKMYLKVTIQTSKPSNAIIIKLYQYYKVGLCQLVRLNWQFKPISTLEHKFKYRAALKTKLAICIILKKTIAARPLPT